MFKPLVNTITMSFGFFPNKGLSNLKPEISDVSFIFSWSYLSSLSFFFREISIINRLLTMLIERNSYLLDYKTILLQNE